MKSNNNAEGFGAIFDATPGVLGDFGVKRSLNQPRLAPAATVPVARFECHVDVRVEPDANSVGCKEFTGQAF
jgi:hypothetical protein